MSKQSEKDRVHKIDSIKAFAEQMRYTIEDIEEAIHYVGVGDKDIQKYIQDKLSNCARSIMLDEKTIPILYTAQLLREKNKLINELYIRLDEAYVKIQTLYKDRLQDDSNLQM